MCNCVYKRGEGEKEWGCVQGMCVGACRGHQWASDVLELHVLVSSLMCVLRIVGALLQSSMPPALSPSVFTFTASRLFLLSTYLMLNCGPLWLSAISPPKLYIV